MELVQEKGLEAVAMENGWLPAGLAMSRKQELMGFLNRFRSLKIRS